MALASGGSRKSIGPSLLMIIERRYNPERMLITEYGWIHVSNGTIEGVRPKDNPAFTEIKQGDDFNSAWQNLQTAEWRLSRDSEILSSGEFEIQIERNKDFTPPR
jgi:hypothetical protein